MLKDTDAQASAPLSVEEQIRQAELDRALAPYQHLLTPQMMAHFRDVLDDMLATHPVAIRVLQRLKPAPVVEKSHKMATLEAPSASNEDEEESAAKGTRSST